MSKPTSAETILHRLLWARQDSLASWACSAATAVLEQLPPNCERSGYRHDVSSRRKGVVAHKLVDLDSSLPVCLVYEWADGTRVVGFCQPWPALLARFIKAIIDGDLLIGADATGNAPAVGR
jgi:hypothetical protein